MNKAFRAAILGFVIALFGIAASMVPIVGWLEEDAGLDWLFTLRGPRTPPSDVVIVTIDKVSADALNLQNTPDNWPRTLHARLIKILADSGAVVIIFDIFFKESRNPNEDIALSRAIKHANNVVLFESIEKQIITPSSQSGSPDNKIFVQRLIPPIPQFRTAARGLAPFPLPVVPMKVSQFWAFNPGTGDQPTLPVLGYHLFVAETSNQIIEAHDRIQRNQSADNARLDDNQSPMRSSLEDKIRTLRIAFKDDVSLKTVMLNQFSQVFAHNSHPEKKQTIRTLINLYSGGDSRYLNYYGPPQAITSVPYVKILNPDFPAESQSNPVSVAGKAVFVGFSERLQPEQKDQFFSVFSQKSGLSLSGVEIAATAFANLLEDRFVQPIPIPARLLLLLCWGFLIGFCCRFFSVFKAIFASLAFSLLYLGMAYYLFSKSSSWLPLIVPLFLQWPLALFLGLVLNYRQVSQERERIRTAFGYYLPPKAVAQISQERARVKPESQLMYGTCLSTDAENYTGLSEGMDPERLATLMNKYYESLFRPVREYRGFVSDVLGDSMLAIWATVSPNMTSRCNALKAALEIGATVHGENSTQTPHYLPTRLGLHSGNILLGSIGALDHYEYRAVGDIVNTANRIQGLNKFLGTCMLASEDVLQDTDEFIVREVGVFLLTGKTQPITIYELIGHRSEPIDQNYLNRIEVFSKGLRAFRSRKWSAAIDIFTDLYNGKTADGVSHFYLSLCIRYRHHPPKTDWTGEVRLDAK